MKTKFKLSCLFLAALMLFSQKPLRAKTRTKRI